MQKRQARIYTFPQKSLYSKGVSTPTMFVSSFGSEHPADVYDWMFAAWRYQGVEAQHRIYSDEGHVLAKPSNQRDLLMAAIEWIDRHMQK